MSIFKTFKTDRNAEVNGVWVDLPANDDGTVPSVLVARMSRTNPEYQAALDKVGKKFKRDIELDILDNKTAAPVVQEVFINVILKDWKNFQNDDGEDIPFSKEAARALFEELPDLYDYLANKAKAISTFRDTDIETATGE